MVRVERAYDYVRFVSPILALADARSVFDVATGTRGNSSRRYVTSTAMSCLGINCIPTPEAYAKKLVAKMKKTASEGGDIMEEHGAELVRAIAAGELVLDVLHLHDVFSSHKEHAQHLDRETCVRHKKLPTVLPMGSLLDELRTSPVDLHPEVKESDGTFTRIIKNLEFQNWGRTVQNRPEVAALTTFT